MERSDWDKRVASISDSYSSAQPLGLYPVHEESRGPDVGGVKEAGSDQITLETIAKTHLLSSPEEKARLRKIIHSAIINQALSIDQVIHVFNVDRKYAQQLFYKAHAEATINDFKDWDPDFVRDFKRAARLKLANEGLHSDDPRMKRLALQAIDSMPDEIPDPNLIEMQPTDAPQSRHWEKAVQRIGGVVNLDDVLDKTE